MNIRIHLIKMAHYGNISTIKAILNKQVDFVGLWLFKVTDTHQKAVYSTCTALWKSEDMAPKMNMKIFFQHTSSVVKALCGSVYICGSQQLCVLHMWQRCVVSCTHCVHRHTNTTSSVNLFVSGFYIFKGNDLIVSRSQGHCTRTVWVEVLAHLAEWCSLHHSNLHGCVDTESQTLAVKWVEYVRSCVSRIDTSTSVVRTEVSASIWIIAAWICMYCVYMNNIIYWMYIVPLSFICTPGTSTGNIGVCVHSAGTRIPNKDELSSIISTTLNQNSTSLTLLPLRLNQQWCI